MNILELTSGLIQDKPDFGATIEVLDMIENPSRDVVSPKGTSIGLLGAAAQAASRRHRNANNMIFMIKEAAI